MADKKFAAVAARETNPQWEQMIKREEPLYRKENDVRTAFERDCTRLLHCTAYRRLKHKTQVFFSPQNDHICTRIEHVNYVESISYTIAKELGLNIELTKAIALGHDLGHAPFGHQGESILKKIAKEELNGSFWHEQNGLHFVDDIELLEDQEKNNRNLDLTYAVRDGIISHCGEVEQKNLRPREEAINLKEFVFPSQYQPFTWEGCVVKVADKISYIGRDIEDALNLKILTEEQMGELTQIINQGKGNAVNNTMIINRLILDVCANSNPCDGIAISAQAFETFEQIRAFNTQNLYHHPRLQCAYRYFELVLREIYNFFKVAYNGKDTGKVLQKRDGQYHQAAELFIQWLQRYSDLTDRVQTPLTNKLVYYICEDEKEYKRAILTYISGMTDNYALDTFQKILRF